MDEEGVIFWLVVLDMGFGEERKIEDDPLF